MVLMISLRIEEKSFIRMIKAIIFDYDGVIVDSFADLHEVYKIMCREVGRECPNDLEEFRKIFGFNYLECYKNLNFSEDDAKMSSEIYVREIRKRSSPLFPGIESVLKYLKDKFTLALISGNNKEAMLRVINGYNLDKYFELIDASSHFDKSKVLRSVSVKLGLPEDEIVVIGDRRIDVDMAKKAGYKNVLIVDYGWERHEKPLTDQEIKIEKTEDILKAVEAIENGN